MNWKWYLTIAAVKQYMDLAGYSGPTEDDNPDFIRAENELGEHSLTARPVVGKNTRSGAILYRTGMMRLKRGRGRLEFTVSPIPRKEGKLPQLLRVTWKP